jgi:aminopeptidase N
MPSLTREEAVTRSGLLDVHAYHVDLDLTAAVDDQGLGAKGFESTTTITFACRQPGSETFVELKDAQLRAARLNGAELDPATLAGNRLPLPGLTGENELVVRATMAYSNTGEGLHRFTDPGDGSVYLYAQAFLDDAQRTFACFDQPDLKAPFTMTISAPQGWEVAANGAGTQVAPGRWEFEPTRPLATYFVSLLAGPYHVRRDSHDGMPLALYCRRGLAPHLDKDAEEIFGVTKACLDRYHELFGMRYPFGKYDQAFVPEFNAGAMENPGLVTVRDEFVFRSAVSESERELRAVVLAHEMAHMWFGDVVTMRWWEDLWLNESFAEYMGYRVVAEATRFTNAWVGFSVGRKGWGYAADQRPSTHPVAPDSVDDTAMALLNFDGISYAKGAAVLRQLAAWIGDEAFVAGLRAHFEAHAFGNATLADLLQALSVASGRDLRGWAEVWLRRPYVNTLRPEVSVGPDGRYSTVDVVQAAPPNYPTLRPHRIGIGVYSGGSLRQRVEVDLDPAVDQRRTPVAALVNTQPGDLLLLNDGDLTYAKIRFDEASWAKVSAVLPALTDPLARALVWAAFVDAVRDAEVKGREFVALCASALPSESELAVFRDVVTFATAHVVDCYLPVPAQPPARALIASACRAAMAAAGPGDGRRLTAARGFITSTGPDDVEELRGWLAGSGAPAGLEIDAELRWTVVNRLAVLGAASEDDIDREYAGDRTAAGAEHAARCRAARPDPAAKAEAWRLIIEDDTLSNRLVMATAEGFWQPSQQELTRPYVDRCFVELPAMAARRTPQVVLQIASACFPRYAVEPAVLEAAERMLARPDLKPVLRRVAADRADDLRRALAARTLEGQ